MGKVIRAQRIGKSPRRASPSHRFKGKAMHPALKLSKEQLVKGKVTDIFHAPGRNTPLAKVMFENKEKSLLIAPLGIAVGDEVSYGVKAEKNLGSCLYISQIPEGTQVYNVESLPGDGGKFGRSAGNTVRIVSHDAKGTVIQLPSGSFKTVNNMCRANIGVAAGSGRHEKPMVKAGNKRYLKQAKSKIHSVVCGVNMNPRDHPFGGGRHPHTGKPITISRHAPPGRKIGSIGARRSGKKR
jgi:large subunit ribosomal protein L2|tara:strand:- start:3014 stop:3733 length:720 start_codon:yes stop_codon:yes gene_type:complete